MTIFFLLLICRQPFDAVQKLNIHWLQTDDKPA